MSDLTESTESTERIRCFDQHPSIFFLAFLCPAERTVVSGCNSQESIVPAEQRFKGIEDWMREVQEIS